MNLKRRLITEIERATYPVQHGQLYLRKTPAQLADALVAAIEKQAVDNAVKQEKRQETSELPLRGKSVAKA